MICGERQQLNSKTMNTREKLLHIFASIVTGIPYGGFFGLCLGNAVIGVVVGMVVFGVIDAVYQFRFADKAARAQQVKQQARDILRMPIARRSRSEHLTEVLLSAVVGIAYGALLGAVCTSLSGPFVPYVFGVALIFAGVHAVNLVFFEERDWLARQTRSLVKSERLELERLSKAAGGDRIKAVLVDAFVGESKVGTVELADTRKTLLALQLPLLAEGVERVLTIRARQAQLHFEGLKR